MFNVKKNVVVIISFSYLLMAAGCSKPSHLSETIWFSKQGNPPPRALKNPEFSKNEITLSTKNEKIDRAPQRIGEAEVEGSFLQKISSKKGELEYVKVQLLEGDLNKLKEKISELHAARFTILADLKKTNRQLRSAFEVYDPKVYVIVGQRVPEIILSMDFVDVAKTGVFRLRFSQQRGVLSVNQVSSGFTDGAGIVYPLGPKVSQLTEMSFKELTGDGSLSKRSLTIVPQVSLKAQSSELLFNYDPADVRFDQVQTFFYVDRALNFFRDKMGITLPFSLNVQTEYGAPEKMNAMFYYGGQIRLSGGDGVSYHHIMRDPSIVIHEASHAVIEAIAHLPMGEGEGGSLNEGFADFFTTVYLNNPNLAEVAYIPGPYKRTVANNSVVSEKSNGLYHDSLILSGTFWEIKNSIGDDKAIALAVKTLARLGPNGNFQNLKSAVTSSLENGFSDDEKLKISKVLTKRGW